MEKDWWKGKVAYQIYPKSFKDSNGDGVGDLKGITEKLDCLQDLGIDILWLSPIYKSPFIDQGYDISDYYAIDPIFGTMEDLELLIAEAKKRNIYLMFDMVFNHTSTEHIWFQEALKGNSKYKNYYFFKKGKNGNLPTNWDSKFGGKAWKYVPEFDEYYLHLYDEKQADLNWENEEVRNELIKIVNFWLKKGIRGFRFDVINNIDKRVFADSPDGLGKQFYCDQPKVHKYLHEVNTRSFGRVAGCITVGEMSATSVENCIGYTNPQNKELDMVFSFHHLKVDYVNKEKWTSMPFDFQELKELLNTWQVRMQEGQGWNALFWNCHDQPRSVSRFGDDKKFRVHSAKMLATAIHLMRGTPYIYQGEELGMTNVRFDDINDYNDIESLNMYKDRLSKGYSHNEIMESIYAKGRDNARTPMQWDDSENAGFTTGTPWLAVNKNYDKINAKQCLQDENSIFNHYKKLIDIRKNNDTIIYGDYKLLCEDDENIFAYVRELNGDKILVVCNFYDKDVEFKFEGDFNYSKVLLSNYNDSSKMIEKLKLRPYEAVMYRFN